MALVVKDRVRETSTTTGTGTFTLAGASTGFQAFSVIGDGNTTYYTITDGTDFEVGIGTYTLSGTTLSRDTILESSNSGSAVNWGAGSKDVFVTYPAERAVYTDGAGTVIIPANPTLTGVTLAGEAACADNLVTRATLKDYAVEGSAIGNTGATRTFDLSVANFFSATLDQNCTFTFSNPPASGDFGVFVLELTNGGAYVITYPASVDFVGGTAPTLTASGVDQLVFTTRDGGTTYFGFVAGLDIK